MANTPDKNFRIQTGIGKNSDNDVNSLTLDVEDGLANNPAFPNLPVKLTDLETQRLAYVYHQGTGGIVVRQLSETEQTSQ